MSRFKVLSVDPGKGRTKFAFVNEKGEIEIGIFDTRMTKINGFNDTDIVGRNNFKVEHESNTYIIGSQGETDATDERTKKSELHKTCTLTATTQALAVEEKEIILVNNIPAATYKSRELKSEYEKLYKGQVDIVVNSIPYSFEIKEVLFLPETAGFQFKYPKLYKKGKVCIVDIGKFNIGLVVYNNGSIQYMETLDYGGIQLENLVISHLETKFDIGVSRDKIFDYLKDGHVKKWGEELIGSDIAIEEAKLLYLDRIIEKAIKKNIDLEAMDNLYFIGGTSLILESNIEAHEKLSKISQVMEDAETISVVGNLQYGVNRFNG